MTIELTMLASSILLGLLQILLAAHTKSRQYGYRWAAGPRDAPVPPLAGMAGRMDRALRNFLETFPLFAAAVLIAHAAGSHGWLTVWGAQLYFWSRAAYVIAYASGVFLVRSVIWNLGTIGIVMILVSLL